MTTADGRRAANPRGQGGRLRGELLAAASRLVDTGGPGAVLTLRGVAREAGVAAPSVYDHFRHLDQLLDALAGQYRDELAEAVSHPPLRVRDGSPGERLRATCRAYLRWGLDRPGRYALAMQRRPGSDLVRLLAARLAALDPPPANARAAAYALWAGLHGIVGLRTASPELAWPAPARQVDALLDGVLPRSAPTRS